MEARANRYARIIERIFFTRYRVGDVEVEFPRDDLARVAAELAIELPKNLGDIVYSFRYRSSLPESVRLRAPEGRDWIIRPAGRARDRFVLVRLATIRPNPLIAETKIPDATPSIVTMYRLNDEQALLAKLRYNRLIDIFTGVTCYSLQNHLRTTVKGLGQIETDEIYVGVNHLGTHFVVPVQAKGGSDTLSTVQIEQDYAMCRAKFPTLVCRPVAAQFMSEETIALFDFEEGNDGVQILSERHYRLVPPEDLPPELQRYQNRT